jgi:hypothetical protein
MGERRGRDDWLEEGREGGGFGMGWDGMGWMDGWMDNMMEYDGRKKE